MENCNNEKKEIIISNTLKGVVGNTRSLMVWNGSKEDKWNDVTSEMYNYMEKSFFMSGVNQYNKKCGWYLKYEDLKPLLENIHSKILEQHNYKYLSYMINNYNVIVEFINSEIEEQLHHLPILKNCNNNLCIFNLTDKCCHKNQKAVHVDDLYCDMSIRCDYYELLDDLQELAKKKIKTMDIDELIKFMSH